MGQISPLSARFSVPVAQIGIYKVFLKLHTNISAPFYFQVQRFCIAKAKVSSKLLSCVIVKYETEYESETANVCPKNAHGF